MQKETNTGTQALEVMTAKDQLALMDKRIVELMTGAKADIEEATTMAMQAGLIIKAEGGVEGLCQGLEDEAGVKRRYSVYCRPKLAGGQLLLAIGCDDAQAQKIEESRPLTVKAPRHIGWVNKLTGYVNAESNKEGGGLSSQDMLALKPLYQRLTNLFKDTPL